MTDTKRGAVGGPFATMKGVELKIDRKTILDYVDLTVHEGELLALVGANGAGKSSIMRCLGGMWQNTAGEIKIRGLDRYDDDLAIRRFTAYLPGEGVGVALAWVVPAGLLAAFAWCLASCGKGMVDSSYRVSPRRLAVEAKAMARKGEAAP